MGRKILASVQSEGMPGNQHVWAGLMCWLPFQKLGQAQERTTRFPWGVVGPAVFNLAGMSFPRVCCQATSVPQCGFSMAGSLTGATQSMAGGILNQSTGVCCKTFLSKESERFGLILKSHISIEPQRHVTSQNRHSDKVRRQHISRPSMRFTLGELI